MTTTRRKREKSKRIARDKRRRCSLHGGGKSMSSNLFHLDKALSSKVADEHDPSDPGLTPFYNLSPISPTLVPLFAPSSIALTGTDREGNAFSVEARRLRQDDGEKNYTRKIERGEGSEVNGERSARVVDGATHSSGCCCKGLQGERNY